MNNHEPIIRQALAAYPGCEALPYDFQTAPLSDLVKAAQRYDFGDTLLSSLILELYEGLEGAAEPHRRAVELLDRALADLVAVRNALVDVQDKPLPPPVKPLLFLCVIARGGVVVSASLHNTADEAIAEAQTCGDNQFRPDDDDIAVLELNPDGTGEDRIYTYEKPFGETPKTE